ncbi:methyl-accepting chemotaxis protein [Beggiatoa alba]|nr:methyl-accepting chemotaxis protein [Beggiatoa alba]
MALYACHVIAFYLGLCGIKNNHKIDGMEMLRIFKKLNLTTKFVAPLLSIALLTLSIGAYVLTRVVEDTTETQINIAQNALQIERDVAKNSADQALLSKADIIGQFMAKTAPDLISAFDFESLKDYQVVAAADMDIIYAAYLKPDGETMTEYQSPEDKSNIIEKTYPIIYDGDNLGSILLGISTVSVNAGITQSNQRIGEQLSKVKNTGSDALAQFITIKIVGALSVLVLLGIAIYVLFNWLIIKPTKETTQRINDLSAGGGDLTTRLPIDSSDEISDLRTAVNTFVAQLQEMIADIVADVKILTDESNQLKISGNELSITSDSQSKEATQVATAINQMSATVHEVAQSSSSASEATQRASEQTRVGIGVVNDTVNTINNLASEVENASTVIGDLADNINNISSVVDVIRGIAEQTNLLALNAAIEAARAGDQGRGFAVVADEVRTLASRTQQSTQEISAMIEHLQSGASNAVAVMEKGKTQAKIGVDKAAEAGRALEAISETTEIVNNMNMQIAAASEEQSAVANEIDKNVGSINTSSKQSADSAIHIARASEQLSNLSVHLQSLTAKFKI